MFTPFTMHANLLGRAEGKYAVVARFTSSGIASIHQRSYSGRIVVITDLNVNQLWNGCLC